MKISMKWMFGTAAVVALSACQPGADTTKTVTTPVAEKTPDATATAAAAGGAKSTLTATAAFTGTAPVMAPLKREADAFCGKTKMTSEEVLVKDGKLQNVLVRVTAGASGSFAAPAEAAQVDQNNCMYRPRVQGVVAGQSIAIKNSDGTGHNVHTYKGEETIFNRAQPTAGTFTKEAKDINVANGPITFKCDIHPWMTGYVVVSPNPYFAVTDATGLAKIELPAGKYTLEAWHEKYGVKSAEVTVEEGKPAEVKFEYSGAEKTGS